MLAALLGTLGGCGGGGGPTEARTQTVAGGGAVEIVGRDYSFDPATLVVERAGRLDLTLDNRGALAHNLRLLDAEGRDVGGTPTFQGGEARSGSAELEAGTYRMVCTVGNHEELGMVGEVEVGE